MAPKILRCLLQVCFDDAPEDSADGNTSVPPQPHRISRFLSIDNNNNSDSYTLAEVDEPVEGHDGEGGDDCCDTHNSNSVNTPTTTNSNSVVVDDTATTIRNNNNNNNNRMSGIRDFWRSVQEKLNLVSSPAEATTTAVAESQLAQEHVPILTQASSFDSSKEVPTIQTEHIVMPGSDLQMQMAKAMAKQLGGDYGQDDDECVICMEGFDPTNPRMPTLCGCGTNKTYFHLPCLYQWVDQSGRRCPSCRKKLRWEEF